MGFGPAHSLQNITTSTFENPWKGSIDEVPWHVYVKTSWKRHMCAIPLVALFICSECIKLAFISICFIVVDEPLKDDSCLHWKHLMLIKLALTQPGKTGKWNRRDQRVLCGYNYGPSPNPTYIQIAAMGDLLRIMVKWLHNDATTTADLQIIGKWLERPAGVCVCVRVSKRVCGLVHFVDLNRLKYCASLLQSPSEEQVQDGKWRATP